MMPETNGEIVSCLSTLIWSHLSTNESARSVLSILSTPTTVVWIELFISRFENHFSTSDYGLRLALQFVHQSEFSLK